MVPLAYGLNYVPACRTIMWYVVGRKKSGCMCSFALESSKKYPWACSCGCFLRVRLAMCRHTLRYAYGSGVSKHHVFSFRDFVSPAVGVQCVCVQENYARSVSGCVGDDVVAVACRRRRQGNLLVIVLFDVAMLPRVREYTCGCFLSSSSAYFRGVK